MGKKKEAKEREHALLSASSSHKWLHCPPSARLEYVIPDTTSQAAAEGTLAHSICELKLTKLFTDKNMTTRTYNGRMKKLQEDELYLPEMERHTDTYVDYVKGIAFAMPTAPTVMVEKRIDYGSYAPEGFGTGDCIMLQGNNLHLFDFKYGQGVAVYADDNPQLKLYALGALQEFGFIYPIENITLHIIQPRRDSNTRWTTTKAELQAWGEQIKPIAEQAYKGEGDFCQGAWCDSCFCSLAGTCRHRAEENLKLMEIASDPVTGFMVPPATLSNEEVGSIMKRAAFLESWAKKLKKYAEDTLLAGDEIPGWKLVEGRSNRVFTDPDAVAKAVVASGYNEALLYERKMLTLTELEKLVDKDVWNTAVSPYVMKPPGKPTVVPADDRRPEYKPGPSAEEAFGGTNQYKEEK